MWKKILLSIMLVLLLPHIAAQETGGIETGGEDFFSFAFSLLDMGLDLLFGISELQIGLIVSALVILFAVYLLRAKILVFLNFLQDGTMVLILLIIAAIIIILVFPDAITGLVS